MPKVANNYSTINDRYGAIVAVIVSIINDRCVPIAASRDALFSDRYGESRRQKKTHRGDSGLINRVTGLRVLSILVAARRTGWDVDHKH